jgi:hypothetical protein
MVSTTMATFTYIRVSTVNLDSIGALIERPGEVGNDGLTHAERARDRAQYAATGGRTPAPSIERAQRLTELGKKLEPRPVRRHAST